MGTLGTERDAIQQIIERVERDTRIRTEIEARQRRIDERLANVEVMLGSILDTVYAIYHGINWLGRLLGHEWHEGKRMLDEIDAESRNRLMEREKSLQIKADRDVHIESSTIKTEEGNDGD